MHAHSAGEDIEGLTDALGNPVAEADRSAGAIFRLHRWPPAVGPGSWRLALAALRDPTAHAPAAVAAALLPHGFISTEPLKDVVRRAIGADTAIPPGLWIMACDLDTGRRVAFGREDAPDAPDAELPDAVAASCAIPGFYRPVRIGRRRYVDGGVWSPSNLDVVAGHDLDLVICLNPSSTLDLDASPGGPVARRFRATAGRRLGREARRVRGGGADVVLVQPTAEDLRVMGVNPMSRRRRHDVLDLARRTVGAQLDAPEAAAALAALPRSSGPHVARPDGPAATWPDFRELARHRVAERARAMETGEPPALRKSRGHA
jgi:NTE family protein